MKLVFFGKSQYIYTDNKVEKVPCEKRIQRMAEKNLATVNKWNLQLFLTANCVRTTDDEWKCRRKKYWTLRRRKKGREKKNAEVVYNSEK